MILYVHNCRWYFFGEVGGDFFWFEPYPILWLVMESSRAPMASCQLWSSGGSCCSCHNVSCPIQAQIWDDNGWYAMIWICNAIYNIYYIYINMGWYGHVGVRLRCCVARLWQAQESIWNHLDMGRQELVGQRTIDLVIFAPAISTTFHPFGMWSIHKNSGSQWTRPKNMAQWSPRYLVV
jgi:hypothetical protein